MVIASVWEWPEDDLEVAGKNVEKYVSKRWKNTTKEGSVTIKSRKAWDEYEGIEVRVTTYINGPRGVKRLAEDLLELTLIENCKPYFITVGLYESAKSEEEKYRNNLSTVRKAYKEREQVLVQRFKNHPKIRPLLSEGRSLIISATTSLLCEMKSKKFNKVIVEVNNSELEPVIDVLHSFTTKLVEYEIAISVVGYSLGGSIDKFEIEDLYVEDEKVYLDLTGYPFVTK